MLIPAVTLASIWPSGASPSLFRIGWSVAISALLFTSLHLVPGKWARVVSVMLFGFALPAAIVKHYSPAIFASTAHSLAIWGIPMMLGYTIAYRVLLRIFYPHPPQGEPDDSSNRATQANRAPR